MEGSASNVVAHFTNSGNNYESAWEILCNRYHKEKKIIIHLLNKMFSLKVIHNESAQELPNLADSFKIIQHFLKNLKEPVNEWNSILIFMLIQRLPMDILSMWEQSCEDSRKMPKLQDLHSFFEKRIRALETIELRSGQEQEKSSFKEKSSSTGNSVVCTICDGHHKPYNCSRFARMSYHKRKEYVQNNPLCFVCLELHATLDCNSPYKCRMPNCGRRHNIF